MARSAFGLNSLSIRFWLGLVAALVFAAACTTVPGSSPRPQSGGDGSKPVASEPVTQGAGAPVTHMGGRTPVRVALLLPMSAQSKEVRQIAKALLDAAQLAVFEVGNPDFLLVPKDTGGTAAGAEAAARASIREGAELILGPVLKEEVTAISPVAQASRVPVIAFSTDRDVAGQGVYLLSFQAEQEVDRVLQFAIEKGRTRFAALIPVSEYGDRVRTAVVDSLNARGGRLIALQPYARDPAAMFDPVKALAEYQKSASAGELSRMPPPSTGANPSAETAAANYQYTGGGPFDAVLLPEGGTLLRALAPLLPYYDVDPRRVKFLGTGLWDDPVLSREPALVGGWFAAPAPEARQAFVGRFERAYGRKPPRIASLSFDAVALAGALARLPRGERFSSATLTNANGFSGIDGIFRFGADGSTERGLAVLEVTPEGFVTVSPAPTSFVGFKAF